MLKNSANRRGGTWSLSPQRPSMNTFTRKRKEGTSLGFGLEDQTKRRRVSGSGQTKVPGSSKTGITGNQAIIRANNVWYRLIIGVGGLIMEGLTNGMHMTATTKTILSVARLCSQVRLSIHSVSFTISPVTGSQQHGCSNDNKLCPGESHNFVHLL